MPKSIRKNGTKLGFKKGVKTWNKGIKMSDELRKKMSDSKQGFKPWNTGKKLTEEHKKKISLGGKGIKRKEITKIRISKAIQGSNHWNWRGGKRPYSVDWSETLKRSIRLS